MNTVFTIRVPTDGDVIMTSSPSSSVPVFNRSEAGLSSRDDHYGDLELFLYGEQLGHLIPLFKEHRVEFGNLLSMTDTDLLQVSRKRVINVRTPVHVHACRTCAVHVCNTCTSFYNLKV